MVTRHLAISLVVVCLVAGQARGDLDEFRTTVAPLLDRHCGSCHGSQQQEGDLRIDTLIPSFSDPGLAARWREVMDRINSGEMPPEDQPRLPEPDAKTIVNWIEANLRAAQLEQVHWAFQPLANEPPPDRWRASGWIQNAVDCFVLAKRDLEFQAVDHPPNLKADPAKSPLPPPSPEADRATLICRGTLDLTGLPPTPEEVQAFLQDQSPDAWERVIDRLLASPGYGERWGRHWLDLAQYADSSGFHNDLDRPYAWKYRDYVIRSFNEDKPFPRFVAEQLAGDEVEGACEESLIATGFCRNGPSNDDNMGKTPEAIAQYRADQLDNMVSTTSAVFLGLTIGCARCHNHKTEPLTSRDYYSLVAIFNGTKSHGLVPGTEDSKGSKVALDPTIKIQACVERDAEVPPTFMLRRGTVSLQGEEVGPAVPAVLAREPLQFPQPVSGTKSSLRRRTFAEWLTAPNHPLTWRVLANRIWQHHFGKGIVTSPSNFGVSGDRPTHPELLDWLAVQLIRDGGQIKRLHRVLLTSATYRQSSRFREDVAQVDPENRLLWRMNLRRLEAECLRDSILASSGNLNFEVGGPGIKPRIRTDLLTASQRNKWPAIDQESSQHWRRSVYIYSKRQLRMPILELFDAPTTTDSCAVRLVSVVPTQSLVLMNDEFVEDQARSLAARAMADRGDDLRQIVRRMFELSGIFTANDERVGEAIEFVRARETAGGRLDALADLAHVILNSSEFLYVE